LRTPVAATVSLVCCAYKSVYLSIYLWCLWAQPLLSTPVAATVSLECCAYTSVYLSIYRWCLWGVFKPLAHPGCCHYSPLSLPLSLDECRPASGRKHAQMKENCFSIPNLTALVEPKIANLIKNKCLSIVFFTSGKKLLFI